MQYCSTRTVDFRSFENKTNSHKQKDPALSSGVVLLSLLTLQFLTIGLKFDTGH